MPESASDDYAMSELLVESAWVFSDDCRRWIAEHRLEGTADDLLVQSMVGSGADSDSAWHAVAAVASDPVYEASSRLASRLRRLEALLDVQGALRELSPQEAEVERAAKLTTTAFLERHYAVNRPVVLTDVGDRWPALRRWSPAHLRERLGDIVVEAMVGRSDDDEYEINAELHRAEMSLAEYVERVLRESPTNDLYLVANNQFFARAETRALLTDIVIDGRYLAPERWAGATYLWFGPAGTLTPLHHDAMNVLLVQVLGRKRVTLVSPLYSHRVYNTVGVYSPVDAESSDLDEYPRFAGVPRLTVTLHPGEALFIPVGWWHQVASLDVAISVSETNFRFPNEYVWAPESA
jgi:hypothetical protein